MLMLLLMLKWERRPSPFEFYHEGIQFFTDLPRYL
jgi:hypothetical protein